MEIKGDLANSKSSPNPNACLQLYKAAIRCMLLRWELFRECLDQEKLAIKHKV